MTLTLSLLEGDFSFSLPDTPRTLLQALFFIRDHYLPTLAFDVNCRSGICGACAVMADGKQVLACSIPASEGMVVSPLRHIPLLKDLRVSHAPVQQTLIPLLTPLPLQNIPCSQSDREKIDQASACILCTSCYSACPVTGTNPNFIGPFALSRLWRYRADIRHNNRVEELEAIQQNGIWDCILCGDCALICPTGVNPKNDITFLRAQSVANGFSDPNTMSFGFGTNNFGGFNDFGF